ncbi:FAD/NAD(P)-binding domain-containing protein [Hyaloscypha variabilis F]|uniref:FAD/NAD(P)-binding domain-containing protein n=1 Tax=Hyaloscypha variabilis (strain UAMH 11265 / GT02V1 / F) TaxID=1149755 RepID=A0A2J6RM63_HYAVF|nr:FAD/NAD(P)-binding domain-containing protein [Hyaloscypha variabilis F]
MATTHEIVILGAHHGGVNVAHYLLRHIIPPLSKLTPSVSYHLTIVAPNTDFYWNVATPRHLVSEDLIPGKDVWFSITDAFARYDQKSFKFIQGKAMTVNPTTRTVTVTKSSNQTEDLVYSTLVIATGSSYASPLWQINEKDGLTKAEISRVREALKTAKTVLISGGGAVGVETAGEIGSYYPKKNITLLSGTTRLLIRLSAYNSAKAESKLRILGVKTLHNLRVSSVRKNEDGSTTLGFSDGSSRPVDVFIDATGPRPNSTFLPTSWIDPRGHVIVDPLTLRTKTAGVYAVGDVANYCDGGIISTGNGIAPVCTSIGIDIAKAAGKEIPFKQKYYKGIGETQFVPTGPSGGVGQIFGWWIPSWMVWLIKSRSFFLSMARPAVEGGNVIKP